MKAFYFSNEKKQLAYNDSRDIVVGKCHTVSCKPKVCKKGLHGSVDVLDALQYATSNNLYLVNITGDVDIGVDKICGKRRKYLAHCDITDILFEFAKQQALINIYKIKPYCSDKKYQLILKFLEGDDSLRSAAGSAAGSVWEAAGSAAWSARSVTWAAWAARSAAWSAAWAAWSAGSAWAAWAAAGSAERAAAGLEVCKEQNKLLTGLIKEKTGWDI